MGKSLVVGPNSVTAKVDANLADIFTVDNCLIIYLADGLYKSWQPGRDLNAITALVSNNGYIAIMKQTLDVDELLDVTDQLGQTLGILNNSQETFTMVSTPTQNQTSGEGPFPVGYQTIAPGDFLEIPKNILDDNTITYFTLSSSGQKKYAVSSVSIIDNVLTGVNTTDDTVTFEEPNYFNTIYPPLVTDESRFMIISDDAEFGNLIIGNSTTGNLTLQFQNAEASNIGSPIVIATDTGYKINGGLLAAGVTAVKLSPAVSCSISVVQSADSSGTLETDKSSPLTGGSGSYTVGALPVQLFRNDIGIIAY